MAQSETVIGRKEDAGNTVILHEVEDLRTGTVYSDGRLFVGNEYKGEYIEYTITKGEVFSRGPVDGPVTVHGAEELVQKKILQNGALHFGKGYAGEDVTVVFRVLNDSELAELSTIDTQK